MTAIIILVFGAIAVTLFYLPFGLEWHRKGDSYAVAVTIFAATGSFIPFMGFAAIAHSMASERAHLERMAEHRRAFDQEMDDLMSNALNEAEAAQGPEAETTETP